MDFVLPLLAPHLQMDVGRAPFAWRESTGVREVAAEDGVGLPAGQGGDGLELESRPAQERLGRLDALGEDCLLDRPAMRAESVRPAMFSRSASHRNPWK